MRNHKLYSFFLILLLILPVYLAALSPLKGSAEYNVTSHSDRNTDVSPKDTIIKEQVLLQVPTLLQFPELPRGCEVTSLAMMLNYAGVNVDKLTLAEEVKKVPYHINGLFGNPNQGFVGNMYTFSEPGLAVYNGPIEDLANRYLPGQIDNLSGLDFSAVKKKLSEGKPVWVIIGSTFSYLPEEHWKTWNTNEGEIKITFKVHSVLITGYDDQRIYFNDPFHSDGNRSVKFNDFITSWTQHGSQAISY